MKKSVLAIAISTTLAIVVPILGCAGPVPAAANLQNARASSPAAMPKAIAAPVAGDELTKDLVILDSMHQESQRLAGETGIGDQAVPNDQESVLQQIEQAQQGLQKLDEIRAETMTAADPAELPAELQSIDKARQAVLANVGSIEEAWQAIQRLQEVRAETMTAADPTVLPAELQAIDKAEETVLANILAAQ